MRLVMAWAVVCMTAGSVAAVARSGEPAGQIPQRFTNLQVLPKDIPQPDLVEIMKAFTGNLGVRCEHCHVGSGNDLSQFDFASDDRPAKAIARRMIRMTVAINGEHLRGIGADNGAPKVTCNTCHRGNRKPRT